MRKYYDFAKIYSNLVDAWKPVCEEINRIENEFEKKFHPAVRQLGGKFLEVASELWVATELQKCHHEVKVVRKRKHADLYIENLGIEVKGCTRHIEKTNQGNIPWWGYSFGDGRQLRERDFQICVLVRADGNSIPLDCFVITRQELDHWPITPRIRKSKSTYLIRVSESYNALRALMASWGWQETELEKRLHQQRSDFKDRWDKIEEVLSRKEKIR